MRIKRGKQQKNILGCDRNLSKHRFHKNYLLDLSKREQVSKMKPDVRGCTYLKFIAKHTLLLFPENRTKLREQYCLN